MMLSLSFFIKSCAFSSQGRKDVCFETIGLYSSLEIINSPIAELYFFAQGRIEEVDTITSRLQSQQSPARHVY